MQTYMLDTNVFNDALDRTIELAPLTGGLLIVTGVQEDELRATLDPNRRSDLLGVFTEIAPAVVAASSFCLDIAGAGLDEAHWNDGSGLFQTMFCRLQVLSGHQEARRLNQLRDIAIAETAIKNNAVLISRDRALRTVVLEHGGKAIPPA